MHRMLRAQGMGANDNKKSWWYCMKQLTLYTFMCMGSKLFTPRMKLAMEKSSHVGATGSILDQQF